MMKKFLHKVLGRTAKLLPLVVYPYLVRREVINFFYHVVSDQSMDHVRHLYPVVPTRVFEDSLGYIRERYHLISYQELHAHRLESGRIPTRAAHLSFDDGYAECFSAVRPVLLKHNIPCTFFLTTDLIDNQVLFYRNKVSLCIERVKLLDARERATILHRLQQYTGVTEDGVDSFVEWIKELRLSDESVIDKVCEILEVDWETFLLETQPYLTRTQIKQMHAEGFTIGAHTKSHRKLGQLDAGEIEAEIVESCRVIQNITGQAIVPFSFPHSAWGIDRDFLEGLRNRHPFIGLLFDTKGLRGDRLFIVNRVWAERPLPETSKIVPIGRVLRVAYQEAWEEEVLGGFRDLRGG
jgi:peptidoglycan/xylan/chitin deacetylase (PgdA/CDA1 family)